MLLDIRDLASQSCSSGSDVSQSIGRPPHHPGGAMKDCAELWRLMYSNRIVADKQQSAQLAA